jgi:hypothetical protein
MARRLIAARARKPTITANASAALAKNTSAVSSSAEPSAKISVRTPDLSIVTSVVMPALVAGIHVLRSRRGWPGQARP